jgi:hypothetical protein
VSTKSAQGTSAFDMADAGSGGRTMVSTIHDHRSSSDGGKTFGRTRQVSRKGAILHSEIQIDHENCLVHSP